MRDRPELFEDLRWLLDAWQELSTDRPESMGGMRPIKWSSIDAYARRHGISGEEFEELVRMIRAMDDVAGDVTAQQAKQRDKKPGDAA